MDSLFFYAAKLVWLMIRPETTLAGLVLIGTLALWTGRLRAAKTFLTLGLVSIVTIGVFPVGLLLIVPLEAHHPPAPPVARAAGIIVLGGGEEADRWTASGEIALNEAGERFLTGIALAHRFPQARVVFTGGAPRLFGTGPDTAALATSVFTRTGIAPERIIVENQSRNTAENATLTLAFLTALGEDTEAPWVLVTSAYHMPRALEVFRAAGWPDITPWPTDFRGGVFQDRIGWDLADNLDDLNTAAREWVGLIAYRITGRAK